ncbi:response regulator transcription factor [Neptunomonas qingdaonensis]|uniref:DNA-binding response regulator, OmpR family, contains REC and winged-helix (WHTH) domain n=1 Tax=Neptunomonas qingdaonensis TaxID=1045558 RepID=A0A1I2QUH7_9GAMM|nr:response regulator transcription factor [Neptunomonas qingdaonensis]SFG30919.1 DNA-binding response regulator, OmpR family, contains REC and winged-helix (wHTH) domain [Neptunomonas qingdaonensis]
MKILLVEDEQKIADFICEGLRAKNFSVTHCADGNRGYEMASKHTFDVIILDIMLPGRDGLDILGSLRQTGIDTPIILLTARNELGDRVKGLEMGADDYLAKPFYVEELNARIQALLRRQGGTLQHVIEVGSLQLDCISRSITCHGQSVELTSREFSLLEHLMRSSNQVLTRGQLLEHVWGYDFDPCTNVVDVCIKRIRRKIASLESAGKMVGAIESVRGTGYRLSSR